MRAIYRALLTAGLFAAGAVAGPAAAERPVEDFTSKETMSWAKISPDGSKLVAEMEIEGVRKLAIMPLDGQGALLPIGLGKGELHDVRWVGNDWLVATIGRNGHHLGLEVYLSRVVAFRADGSDMKVIDTRKGMADTGGSILWTAHDGSPHILLEYRESIFIGEEGFFPKVSLVDISKNDFSRVTGVGHRLQITPQLDDVTPTAGIVVFRTLQELLANVARHAKASQVQVDLDTDARQGLTLRVQDNGIGIGPVLRAGACGLHGMRERIRDAGGSLAIDSNGGSGTCVTVSIPRPH